MDSKNIQVEQLKNIFLENVPFIDVRAPVEFAQGHLPGAVNFPILDDAERALIGTIYKQQGNAAAVQKGFEIVSGAVKEGRVQQWRSFIEAHPQTILYCFRGGQRSRITQGWLRDIGIERPLIVGGYKKARQFLMDELGRASTSRPFLVLSGSTGSGKTKFIRSLETLYPSLDLEKGACHRGSAFGATTEPQPTQVNFENTLSVSLLKLEQKFLPQQSILVEDESRMIGRVSVPEILFLQMRASPVIWLVEPLDVRVQNIFEDYILQTAIGNLGAEEGSEQRALGVFAQYKKAVLAIQKKLGGLRATEVYADIERAESDFVEHRDLKGNTVWIEKLLRYYYDPLYLGSLERRQVQIAFKGSSGEALQFLKSLK